MTEQAARRSTTVNSSTVAVLKIVLALAPASMIALAILHTCLDRIIHHAFLKTTAMTTTGAAQTYAWQPGPVQVSALATLGTPYHSIVTTAAQ